MAFVTALEKFASPMRRLESWEVDQAEKWCEVLKAWLAQEARGFVERHATEPMLVFYGCDSTPLSTKEAFTSQQGR